jgi:uncharacterized protein (DUF2237 family)
MGRTVAGVTCPQCKRSCRVDANDVMTRHKSQHFLPFRQTREWCKFSGGTWADAKLGITPHMRKRESHVRRLAKREKRQLTERECKQLMEWGIL